MNRGKVFRSLLAVCLLALSSTAFAKGKLGFATEATSSGFISPVLEKLEVARVRPDSPAAVAGLKVGDLIVEVNGEAVVGASSREMAGRFKTIKAGDSLQLKVRRGEALVVISVVAGAG